MQSEPADNQSEKLSPALSDMEEILKGYFKNCADFVVRPINVSGDKKILLVYIDGLIDTKSLDEFLLKPIFFKGLPKGLGEIHTFEQVIEQQLLSIAQVKTISTVPELIDGILKANLAIMVDGESSAILADLKGFETRSISEPQTEVSIRGPRDGFTELLRTNTTLLRRRIRSSKLKFESYSIGEFSKTDIEIAYIEGLATDTLLNEVRARLERIQIDGVLESEFIEEFIEDFPFSPFPQIQNTERPDIVAASLLEGRVAILVDNTPFVLIVPMTFWGGLQAVEDYYERFIYTTFIRVIRFTLLNISQFLPSVYVALTTYHPELIPTTLLISVAAAREGVPFPAIVEALIMEIVFEGLREAGIRLPKPVGSAVSIVGALVIGQAAVQAGIVSAPMVIVVATTGIASFAIPRYNFGTAFRMIRFVLLILAGVFGFYGIVFGFIAITIHLVNLRSFGIPYFSPVAPQIPSGLKDVIIRVPKWAYNYRPPFISSMNKMRIPFGQKPSPKQGGKDK
ncbi:spore germination protein [Bacillus sp. DTU_2020_1000418_1_SI_GHA_SEK_038]|uniref:spore germination protein n=1 Tax=Bacillus sp. DTU_2020_1000418_1_SI_GHA_SEK_038 TaxID=3077585 RepID=UPI0028E7C2FF|nr:spore germination protein [Bacillus sp. DTU_2020_1000418_1_SI_GHA_SEK_038]WNS77586.1 spore germination protein [Bacillus sp. DTU_2020_1000418_1_SI_GHA_SEK_038]